MSGTHINDTPLSYSHMYHPLTDTDLVVQACYSHIKALNSIQARLQVGTPDSNLAGTHLY